jgi:DNA-binding IclR family transcriptional regulator
MTRKTKAVRAQADSAGWQAARTPAPRAKPIDEDERIAMREIFARAPSIRSRADSLVGAGGLPGVGEAADGRKAPPGIVPALAHALSVIAYLNGRAPGRAALSEIATRLNISKSHCHGILRTLGYFDWVEFDPRLKTYGLQSGALSDISSLLNSSTLDHARSALTRLVERIGVPCVLSEPLPDRSYVVIDTFRSHHFMQFIYPVGHRFPRDACAQMRAYLGWQPAETIDAWIEDWPGTAYTAQTMTSKAAVRAEIAATRKRGYSRSDREFSEGMIAFGLPIFDRDGCVIYVACCSLLASDPTLDERRVAREMHAAVAEIHRATLARSPADFG